MLLNINDRSAVSGAQIEDLAVMGFLEKLLKYTHGRMVKGRVLEHEANEIRTSIPYDRWKPTEVFKLK